MSVQPTRWKVTFLVAMLCAFGTAVHAQTNDQSMQAVIESAKKNQSSVVDPGLDVEAVQRRAADLWRSNQVKSVAGHTVDSAPANTGASPLTGQPLTENALPKEEMMILVSASLGEVVLRQIADDARTHPNTALVFRGFPDGDTAVGPKAIMQLFSGAKNVPVVVDPRPFRDNHIITVPTMILKRGGKSSLVRGITNPRFLLEREPGDYGKQGPTQDISEPDLLDMIATRINQIDWGAKQRRGIERFWSNAAILELPPIKTAQTRTVNMAVQAVADIKDANGNIIVRKGTVMDPMRMVPFNTRLLVFDPNDPKQVAWAQSHVSAEKTTMFLVVNYKREGAWDGWRALIDKFHAPIYLLTSNVRDRFGLAGVPSLVESRGGVMTVQEGFDDAR
ncbi:TrbC family F-type conjugative pilus assembly protein [Desulfovibrio sp.]|uniref:TrbC family F-type conjugative pilus assembly protein n=1 Tax=Desulfovibrio sp. TaxID=885 RepID=UPI0025BC67D8|nr:TrbC family F-type conjugative pilus assembly protein [Desulfovibrio sp.]